MRLPKLTQFFLSLILFFNFPCNYIYGQYDTDSLKSLLPSLNGKEKIDILNQLAYDLKFNDQQISSQYAKEALLLSKSLPYPE